jgi:RimJ/RimL family protein N-acetyltransferase
MAEIDTERLIMRGWRESDLAPWAAMNADPEVRQYLGPLLTFEQASAWVLNYQDDLDRFGFGLWAVEVRASGEFIGLSGLHAADDETPFAGFELAWRFARPAWGHGYATEAAKASLRDAFERVHLQEVLAYTSADNVRSQAVIRRLDMQRAASLDYSEPVGKGTWLVWIARQSDGLVTET